MNTCTPRIAKNAVFALATLIVIVAMGCTQQPGPTTVAPPPAPVPVQNTAGSPPPAPAPVPTAVSPSAQAPAPSPAPTTPAKAAAPVPNKEIEEPPVRTYSKVDIGGDLNTWEDKLPAGWWAADNALSRIAKSDKGGEDESAAAKLTPHAKDFTILVKRIPGMVGHSILARAKVKSKEVNSCALAIIYKVDGKEKYQGSECKGAGEWETLEVSCAVPANADPDSVTLRTGVNPGFKQAVLFDAITLDRVYKEEKWNRLDINGDFSRWGETNPIGWWFSNKDRVKKADQGVENAPAIEITNSASDYTVISQMLIGDFAGKRLSIEAKAKANKPEAFRAGIKFTTEGKESFSSVAHSGGGEWEKIATSAEIPKDVDPDSIQIRIGMGPSDGVTALVDDVICKVLKSETVY